MMICAFVNSEDSAARSEFLKTAETKGYVELSDALRVIERSFDSCAKALSTIVTGTLSALQRSHDLDQLLAMYLERWKPWFSKVEGLVGMEAADVEAAARLRLEGRCHAWKAETFRIALEVESTRENPAVAPSRDDRSTGTAEIATGKAESPNEDEAERRARLLAEYKAATGNPSNKRIYEARGSIHKPDFYAWLHGDLSSDSAMAINFERFLRLRKPPVPRKLRP